MGRRVLTRCRTRSGGSCRLPPPGRPGCSGHHRRKLALLSSGLWYTGCGCVPSLVARGRRSVHGCGSVLAAPRASPRRDHVLRQWIRRTVRAPKPSCSYASLRDTMSHGISRHEGYHVTPHGYHVTRDTMSRGISCHTGYYVTKDTMQRGTYIARSTRHPRRHVSCDCHAARPRSTSPSARTRRTAPTARRRPRRRTTTGAGPIRNEPGPARPHICAWTRRFRAVAGDPREPPLTLVAPRCGAECAACTWITAVAHS